MRKTYLSGSAASLLCSVAFAADDGAGSGSTDKMTVEAALRQLDNESDADWTGGGLPSLDRVGELVGRKVSRQEVTDAKPNFMREPTTQSGATKAAAPTEQSEEPRYPTAIEIAEHCPDAILLMEAAVAAGMTGRYNRNSTLQTLLRGYQSAQAEIKATQARIDQRLGERAKAAEEAAKAAA